MIKIVEAPTRKLPGLSSLFITFDFNRQIIDEIKLLDTRIFDENHKDWEVPTADLGKLLDILTNIDDIDLQLIDTQEESLTTYELLKYKTQPFEHQLEGIQYGLNHDKWLLLDSPGLGKTLQITYLAKELKEKRGLHKCLIICGLNTLKSNWKAEIEKHSDLSCTILGGRINRKGRFVGDGVAKRVEQLKKPIEEFITITNIETLRSDEVIKALLKNKYNQFDMIVLDECHVCKNSQSQQGSNLLKLNKAKYRIGLTGTLLLNSPLDCYVPMKWIGIEKANLSNFKSYYCRYGGIFGKDIIGYKNIGNLKEHLEKYSLRRTKDILNLPPKTIINELVDMDKDQEAFYENIKNGIIDQVDKVHMSNANLLGVVTRLRQATALPSILTSENISSAKIDRAVDLATQLIESGEKVVIFGTFKEPMYAIARRLENYNYVIGTGDLSDEEVAANKDKFQEDPSVKAFIGTWQKCGTGITLNAASYMIFLDVPWTQGVFQQSQDRIHRIGTKNPVFIYHLITKDTIDERVNEIVNDKGAIADFIIDDEIINENALNSLRKYISELS
ncbi:MAG: DEAD/DEAH box helicase [Acholeplasmatales bacterium]|nr:DEAD/DEAH box helicase [Acholeplasmatales bacterium]